MLTATWLDIFVNSVLVSLCINLGVGKHTWDFPLKNLVDMVRIYTAAGTLAVCAPRIFFQSKKTTWNGQPTACA